MAADDIRRTRAECVVLWHRCEASSEAQADAGTSGGTREQAGNGGNDASSAQGTEKWIELVLARVRASGARVLAGIGTTVVATLDSIEVADAIELARSLVEDVAQPQPNLKVDIGVALGEVEETIEPGKAPTYRGAAIDRAQALANRAHAGEVVLDDATVAAACERYLFGREVLVGSVRGQALDPYNARKEECRRALSELASLPLPPSALPVFEELTRLAQQTGETRVALHCTAGPSPLDLIERLARTEKPQLLLRISRKAGGLQPLGGLELALRRSGLDDTAQFSLRARRSISSSGDDAMREPAALPPALRGMLKALLRGQAIARAEMVEALAELLRLNTKAGARPWIVLDQLHEIDPATLGVIAETLQSSELECMLLMTLPIGASVPAALLPEGALHTLTLPPLDAHDGRTLAEALLSLEEGSDIAQRVAAIGGDSPLGVLEAARTLVTAGDLVLQKTRAKGFVWRGAPRSGIGQVPVEALITERALGLPPDAYRVLETLCIAPPDASLDLVESVIERDGLASGELRDGLTQLAAEGFVDNGVSLGSADAAIRSAIRSSMPPARAAELNRFVADELRTRQKAPGFGSAQLAYHLAEGGQEADAARALLDAGRTALQAGFQRVALRLVATAVELDGSPDVRKLASEVASSVDVASVAASPSASSSTNPAVVADPEGTAAAGSGATPNMAASAIASARKALAAHDYDAAERWLDTAVAAGWGRAAAQRMLAMAQLARGDTSDATLTLSRARTPDAPAEVQARDALGWALIHVESGNAALGVRDALGALAASRKLSDARGEVAALHVLAHCYRNLDREDDALRIAVAACAPRT